MKIKQRHFIKTSEIKTLKNELIKDFDEKFINQVFPEKCRVEMIITEEGDVLFAVNNELKLWKSKEGYVPTLSLLVEKKVDLKTIIVDMGAVKYVTNGADIMRPGITKIDPLIKRNDIIQIVDETHHRALAVGKALFDAKEMETQTAGKVIKNLHTIKDKVWEFQKIAKL
jgi:PUA domain protein